MKEQLLKKFYNEKKVRNVLKEKYIEALLKEYGEYLDVDKLRFFLLNEDITTSLNDLYYELLDYVTDFDLDGHIMTKNELLLITSKNHKTVKEAFEDLKMLYEYDFCFTYFEKDDIGILAVGI